MTEIHNIGRLARYKNFDCGIVSAFAMHIMGKNEHRRQVKSSIYIDFITASC